MPKTPLDLTALRAGRPELEAALAAERRKRVRKRLVAIDAILTGKSIKDAARAANATEQTVERCLKRFHQSGLASLLRDRRRRRPKWQMTLDDIETTRREIASALGRSLKPDVRTRLVAIDSALSGRPIEEAAAAAHVLRGAVHSWLRLVTRHGLAPALARWERKEQPRQPQIDADPAALRELAAKEENPRVSKRMLALACVAGGISPHAASFAARLDYSAFFERIRQFREEGMEALYDRAPFGRRQRLTQDQLQELRAEILQHPDLGYRQLSEFIAAQFGVRYSSEGLQLLLKREFGIVCRRRRFTQAPTATAPLAGQNLAQHLNADELRTALARTKDQRLRRKLIALIQLAQGWEPERVALQVGATPETLGNWVALYDQLATHALRPLLPKSP